jgi:hypothetical protein
MRAVDTLKVRYLAIPLLGAMLLVSGCSLGGGDGSSTPGPQSSNNPQMEEAMRKHMQESQRNSLPPWKQQSRRRG